MITLNGQKMGKSLGNAISLEEFFSGRHELLDRGYSPMTIRFFMLQAHYRSTLDFSNEALEAAERGLERLFEGMEGLDRIGPPASGGMEIGGIEKGFFDAMNDDFNTPVAIAHLFEGIKAINSILAGNGSMGLRDPGKWKSFYRLAVNEILGLNAPEVEKGDNTLSESLIRFLLQMRIDARQRKDFALADRIRDEMAALGIEVKDTKNGFEWKRTR
jgi:cysteinyl-tRNA synthetase